MALAHDEIQVPATGPESPGNDDSIRVATGASTLTAAPMRSIVNGDVKIPSQRIALGTCRKIDVEPVGLCA